MKASRRSVLKMGPALAALGWVPPIRAAVQEQAKGSSFDPWVEVHGENLRHNVGEISRRVGGRPIMAVIKNNGYGAGILNIGRLLEPFTEIEALAVVKLQEAMTLRDAGVQKPILLMGPLEETELEDAVARSIMPAVYRPIGDTLDRIAEKLRRRVRLHLYIDTGMGRVGIPYPEAASLIRDLAGRRSVQVEGTMMTFTEDPEFDKEQLRRFMELCRGLETEGISLGKKHAASSFALFQNPEAFLDMVRPGMAVFGVYSEPPFRETNIMSLRPVLSLKSRVIYVKKIPKGGSAGYNRAYTAKQDAWVATLPVGHADGWPRVAAQRARVRINGRFYPVVASVSASHTIVELGTDASVKIGDIATMFDWQDGSRPEDVSMACEASVYDLTMHLNPLLPRRIV